MTIRRLYFHCLRRFSGPKFAAVTKFWHVYHARYSTNYLVMQKLYEEYSTLVRTGPNEITIFHPLGIDLLDGPRNTNTKDSFYNVLRPRTSAIFTRDVEDHRDRRKAWEHSLSSKAMTAFRPRIAEEALAFQQAIATHNKQTVDVNDVMTWFAFDTMGDIVFGEDFGNLSLKQC
ncbi:cytochrome P450 [Massariosphaeria phaeospora]|uniref:Cytochrome P450 n=1 Tax=Massariosphaeria phaeospora TaxID=100035 RepID=A0A7C8MIB7_9PLEO|nr:cytochrome P450 [Massariosphaeria phaeospora]